MKNWTSDVNIWQMLASSSKWIIKNEYIVFINFFFKTVNHVFQSILKAAQVHGSAHALRNSCPVASLRAVEKSSESRTMPECEVRISVRAMLSAIASKAYLITSLKNGSNLGKMHQSIFSNYPVSLL